jgi:hypothetical protein
MMQRLVASLCAILIVPVPPVDVIRRNRDWRTCGPVRDEHLHSDVPASETPWTALQRQIGRAQANAQPAARTVHVRHRISFRVWNARLAAIQSPIAAGSLALHFRRLLATEGIDAESYSSR